MKKILMVLVLLFPACFALGSDETPVIPSNNESLPGWVLNAGGGYDLAGGLFVSSGFGFTFLNKDNKYSELGIDWYRYTGAKYEAKGSNGEKYNDSYTLTFYTLEYKELYTFMRSMTGFFFWYGGGAGLADVSWQRQSQDGGSGDSGREKTIGLLLNMGAGYLLPGNIELRLGLPMNMLIAGPMGVIIIVPVELRAGIRF